MIGEAGESGRIQILVEISSEFYFKFPFLTGECERSSSSEEVKGGRGAKGKAGKCGKRQ